MVPLKGKSRVGAARLSEVDGSNFRVYSENGQLKFGDGLEKVAKEAGVTSRRSAALANKGVIPNSVSRPKVKVALKNVEKSSGKYGTSANINMRKALANVSNVKANKNVEKSSCKYGTSANINMRKALADVSNVQANSASNFGHGSHMKVSAVSGTKIVGISSMKSFTGRVKGNISQGDKQLDASKRVGTDLRASLDDQKNNTDGGQSTVVTKERIARKPVLPASTRKSLPVPRRLNRADMSNTKENASSSGTEKGRSGLPTKATAGGRAISHIVNARSHQWKTRVSDGFVQMVQTNVLQASSRKSAKPIVKTTLKASTAQKTLKSKSRSGQNKSESTSAMSSSQDEESVGLSLPGSGLVVVSDDANQGHLPSDGESNMRTDLSKFIPRKKSTRRKSYTKLLMERSKFLKESGEAMEQDTLPNIDNENNQLEVSEYIDEIYQFYWVAEAQSPALANYMSIQTNITAHMRGILINWLIEVHFKFDLMPETLYLTVSLLDHYLSLVSIKKADMQLVGLTALLLASKYEDFWHPRVKDLISISAESYTRDQMLEMEKLILRKLKFRLNSPTPYVFMVRFLKAAQSDMKLEHLAFFLVDLCLVEYEALACKPSLLCASAIYVARCTLQITPPWTPLLQRHAHYEVSQIRACAEMILKFHKAADRGKLKVTYEKYSRPELNGVASIKPLDRLPL